MSTVIQDFPPLALEEKEAEQAARQPALARRVIVDERRAVVGYQLVPSTYGGTAPAAMADLADAGLSKPTFVRCTCPDMAAGQLDTLDPKTVVLEVLGGLGGDAAGAGLDLAVLQAVRGKGFKLAFDTRLLKKEYAPFVPLASYVMLEMGVLELDRAAALAQSIQAGTRATAFATQVRTEAQYARLASAGVKLFEGRWFTTPPAKPDNTIQLSYASLIKLLNMVVREAEVTEVEELLKREPGLAYKLLRYINSAGFGLRVEITSFRHAVMTVGLKRLFRWTALLIASTPAGNIAPAVGTLAIVRGRMMELMALRRLPPVEADMAFVTGMFSMLDTLLGMPLEDALALVTLPPSVTDALLEGNGVFACYLNTARACETADEGLIEISAARHRVSTDEIIATHLEALAWGEQFGQ